MEGIAGMASGHPPLIYFLPATLPRYWPQAIDSKAYQAIVFWGEANKEALDDLFHDALSLDSLQEKLGDKSSLILRRFNTGVSNPVAQSLATLLDINEEFLVCDQIIFCDHNSLESSFKEELPFRWREPAIENLEFIDLPRWLERRCAPPVIKERPDDSFESADPSKWDLEFEKQEWAAIQTESKKLGRDFNRAELELLAQTWSEHCKHKIFNARIACQDTKNKETLSLFKTHIRQPTLEIMEKRPNNYLSVFHDNAGVVALFDETGTESDWALAIKMETHNSPSAISPYGGASTGVVGVHRDILGTGLGALPIANWDVLCFESPRHNKPRPEKALSADVVREGVIRGIQDGGNQSGIPTVQGSVHFDPLYAVKPLVFAGALGILPRKYVDKKAQVGDKLYCFGGAVGADGLRGAVMSSRDIRQDDFVGSMVQVANAFVQRRMTDFLIEARDADLISSITDNGAGGLASSVGEMATQTDGARIDLTGLRTKLKGLHGWERLLSESQERMTAATRDPEKLEALAEKWKIPFDRLGELNDSGKLVVTYQEKELVDLSLEFLHEACPQMKLTSDWSFAKEREALESSDPIATGTLNLESDFAQMLGHELLCSREGVVRRFDHEVQGRTRKTPFGSKLQSSPQDGSVLEIHESKTPTFVSLSHGLAPWKKDIQENILFAFDEALRSAALCGARLESIGVLDNFCWSDPLNSDRQLWRLVRSCEVLSHLCRAFELPLVSGKDSMKNNSADFRAPDTVVVSMAASTGPIENLPPAAFARSNDVIFYLPPLGATLVESAWERVFEKSLVDLQKRRAEKSSESVDRTIDEWIPQLKNRYETISKLVRGGAIRSIKDISEGGLLTTLFEMAIGAECGVQLDSEDRSTEKLFSEGLGGFVLSLDPHQIDEVTGSLKDLQRLGVVMKSRRIRWSDDFSLDMAALEEAYQKKNREGFWL